MIDSVTIISMNVQCLGDSRKRKDVPNFMKGQKSNIYFLQGTHFTDKFIIFIRDGVMNTISVIKVV